MSQRRRLFRDEAFARRGRTEPIDGLLRITAPHEWLFLALLACALIAVLIWAVFGTIERGLSASCLLGAPATGQIDAVSRLTVEDGRRVAVGMSARVSAFGADGSFDGIVAQVALDPAGSNADGPQTLVVVTLPDAASNLRDGDACDLRIVTSRDAPISLIATIAPTVAVGQE